MIISEQLFDNTISLNSSDLNKDIDNIILIKLKKQYEGLCKDNCFILKNSINIIKRSMGQIETYNNTNIIKYDIKYKCNIISPKVGDIIKCIVSNKNKMGVIAYIKMDEKYEHADNDLDNSPLIIIIPNDLMVENEYNIDDIIIKQTLSVEILDFRIKYRNEKIQIVGKIV